MTVYFTPAREIHCLRIVLYRIILKMQTYNTPPLQVHESSAPPPSMPPPPLPSEYANFSNDWAESRTSVDWASQNNFASHAQNTDTQKRPVSQQVRSLLVLLRTLLSIPCYFLYILMISVFTQLCLHKCLQDLMPSHLL